MISRSTKWPPEGATASCFNLSCVVGAITPRGASRLLAREPTLLGNDWGDTADLRGTSAIWAYIRECLKR